LPKIDIRPAGAEEATALTRLCLRSKAHWGYDAAFMAQAELGLTVGADQIAAGDVFVAIDDSGQVLGVHALAIEGAIADLDKLFVEPAAIGRGVGASLFRHAVGVAASRGCELMTILSDPNAASFYERMGAGFVAMAPSDAIPGRELPLYHMRLRGAETPCGPALPVPQSGQ